MARDSIFKLVKENYNIKEEIEKVYYNLRDYTIFCIYRKDRVTKEEKHICDYNFFDFCNAYLFTFLPDKSTCLTIEEFIKKADAKLDFEICENLSDNRIINFLEVVENMLKIYFDKYNYLHRKYGVDHYEDEFRETKFLIDELEKNMGIKKKVYDDRVILYSDDYKLEQALEKVEEQDLSIELIKYDRENLNYQEKRKILKQLDILVEPLIDKLKNKYKNDKNYLYKIADDLGFIFNNFELRHNNTNPNSNDYRPNLVDFTDDDYCNVYDAAYCLIIDILILNDYEDNTSNIISMYKKKINAKNWQMLNS